MLLDGRKVAGILAQASLPARVVLGIGVNVGTAPWPEAAVPTADRLELLSGDLLERPSSSVTTLAHAAGAGQ